MNKLSLKITLIVVSVVSLLFGCATPSKPRESVPDKMVFLDQEISKLFRSSDGVQISKVERSKEKSVFVLYADRPAPTRKELYANTKSRDVPELYSIFQCDRYVLLEIYVKHTRAGYISIGDCTSKRSELVKLSRRQNEYVDSLIKLYPATDKNIDVRNFGWFYRKTDLSDALVHQFPVFLIGHGMAWPLTTVTFSNINDETYIVQIDVSEVCRIDIAQCELFSKVATDGVMENLRRIF